MKKKIVLLGMAMFLMTSASQVRAEPLLVEWLFNDNGTVFTSFDTNTSDLPGNIDDSTFDWNEGLGSISIAYSTTGNYSFTAFFDLEIVRDSNSFFNEYGVIYGTQETDQSWEIDEPGQVFGDIYDNALVGALDNSNSVPIGWEDDVSMAMGWDFFLQDNETALLTFTLSELIPTSGFYLEHHDPEGSYYFSSSLTIETSTTPVPEPVSALLLGTGLTCLVGIRRRKILQQCHNLK